MEQKKNDRELNQQNKRDSINMGSDLDQREQTVYGDQINVAGNVYGDVILKRLDPTDIRNQRNHAALRQMVRSFWVDGVLQHSLYHEALMRLNLEDRSDLVDNRPWDLILQRPDMKNEKISPDAPMIKIFDQMYQRLLILGEPGSGKTTLLLELADALLKRAESDSTHPTPVVFNLSSWAVERESLAEWLVSELQEKYNIPKKVAQFWIEKNEILPLLDGLDEVQQEHQDAGAMGITRFQQEHLVPLAVCCRLADYERLRKRLRLQGAVLTQPLTEAQIIAHLVQAGSEMDAVLSMIQTDEQLRELSTSPLILSVLMLTYASHDIGVFPEFDERRTRQQRLLDAYIQRAFVHRGMRHLYSPHKTIYWLRWLAIQLVKYRQAIFLIEQMQPNWLSFTHRFLLRTILVFFFVSTICSAIWLIVGGPNTTLIHGVLLGLLFGLQDIFPIETLAWSWKTARVGVIVGFRDGTRRGLGIGLLFGIIVTIAGNLWTGITVWFGTALFFALVSATILGLFRGLNYTTSTHTKTPNQGIYKSIKNAISMWIISVVLLAPVFIFANEIPSRSRDLILIGAIVGFLYGGQAVMTHLLMRIILIFKGYIPVHYSQFLDYACARVLLRRVGGGYVYAHRLIMEHFASLTDEDIVRVTGAIK